MKDDTEGKRWGFEVSASKPRQNNRCTFQGVPQQNTKPTTGSQSFDADRHIRSIHQAMCDAYVMLSGWPACIRYSSIIGSDGCLMTIAEMRGGK